ncbi:mPR-like GPCR protein [Mariannaea sp. PMI_226]|nr:mPR-like GPCR protein [Mariannaea sp. PMI_226]
MATKNLGTPHNVPSTSSPLPPKSSRRLLHAGEVPPWYTHNSFVRTGYRPITGSIFHCFESLGYFHNESVNIYSHLVPAIIAAVSNGFIHYIFSTRYPKASWADQLVFHIYLSTSVLCFTISSTYHTMLCHSRTFAEIWVRLDYVAIVFQIIGSFISGIYVSFYCEHSLQKLYWTMISVLGVLTGIIVAGPSSQTRQWRIVRLTAFVITGFSAFAPIAHAMLIFPYGQLAKQAGLHYYYMEGISIMMGVFFYATHLPESWAPEKYDLWGASHQLFHSFVVLGTVFHLYGIFSAFDWNYSNPRCQAGGVVNVLM